MTARLRRFALPFMLVLAGSGLGAGITVAAYPSAPKYERLPACVHEDGNLDGKPCWWTDPDTGTRYYVTSENYRAPA
jgi:hypothetical protein